MPRSRLALLVVTAAGLIAAVGCAQSPDAKKARHLQRADGYFARGQYGEAIIEYRNLVRLDPLHAQAIYRLGVAYQQHGNIAEAYRFLLRAQELDPGRLEVRHKLGAVHLVGGKVDEARREAEFILQRESAHVDGLLLLAATARTTLERDQAIGRLEAVTSKYPDRGRLYPALGGLYLQKRDLPRAETNFREGVKRDPDSVEARTLLAEYYLLRRNLPAAEAEFKTAASMAPVGSLARMRLVDFYLGSLRSDEAKRILHDITHKAPDFVPAWRRVAQVAFTEARYDDADKAVETVLSRRPADPQGRLLRGRIHLVRRQTTEAIQEFQLLLTAEPRFSPARLQLALAHLESGNLLQAKSELHEGLRLDPSFVSGRLMLAELHLRTGAARRAIEDLERLLGEQPQLVQAYPLLGAAYEADRQRVKATAVYQRFARALPGDPRGPYLLATNLQADGKLPEAHKEYEAALSLDPDFTAALARLVAIDLALNNATAARDRVGRQAARRPGSAEVQQLLGDVYVNLREIPAAEAAYQKALELDPRRSEAHMRLARLYVAAGKPEDALRRVESALALDPRNLSLHMLAGFIHQHQGNIAAAQAAYERALTISPRFALAANNLAWLHLEHGGDQEKALRLARTAHELAPDDPRIADTLGWVLYRRGVYRQAVAVLSEGTGKLPNDPELHYHLGMAHYRLGEPERARQALRVATGSKLTFAGKAEAQRVLAELK